jgi:hypothetical protein
MSCTVARSCTSESPRIARRLGSFFSVKNYWLGNCPQSADVRRLPGNDATLYPSIHKNEKHHLAQCLQIERHQCKPLTPSKSAPQPCSAAKDGSNACCSSSRHSNGVRGAVRQRCLSWFPFRKSTFTALSSSQSTTPSGDCLHAARNALRFLSVVSSGSFSDGE